jgi:DNA (cytosine-5)-methyltransferase 1
MSKNPTVLSLYTGAGGLDYGFEAAGYRTAVAVELDPMCVKTLESNRSWPVIMKDIADVTTRQLLSKAGLKRGEADVLIGGPPCQPFSKSGFWATGDAKRLADPRAATLDGYLRVLDEAQPKAFLLENVEGLGFRGKDEGLQLIRQRLQEINARRKTSYDMNVAVLNAAEHGVPQIRKRLFIVGSRDGRAFSFPEPSYVDPKANGPKQKPAYVTTWDALHDLSEPNDEGLRLRGKWADLLPSVPEGENYLWHTERGGGESLFGWRRRYWCFLLKLAKNQPSWTLQAQPGPATGPFHWNDRLLSGKEMARLQTFPDNVELAGSYADVRRQLGNAVPSLLAEVIARAIRSQLLDRPLKNSAPKLAVARFAGRTPAPERVRAVPKKYRTLRGDHEAHPGTGKGYGATARMLDADLALAE